MNLSPELVALVGIVIALVEIIKRVFPQVPGRFFPLASLVLGVVLGFARGFGWFEGLLLGLSASGVYDTAKVSIMGK